MCREHYRTLLKQFPIEPFLDSRDALISWVVLIHNQVNIRLGKPTMSKEVVMQKYKQAYTNQSFCQLTTNSKDDVDIDLDGLSSRHHLLRQVKHRDVVRHGESLLPWRVILMLLVCSVLVLCVVYSVWRWRLTTS